MTRWSRVLGEHGGVPEAWRGRSVRALPEQADGPVEESVAFAIERAMAHLPVAPSCLAQAFAGQVMLRRRGRSGVVVIGMRRAASGPHGRWDAHAWLLGDRGALTGGPAAEGFTATTVFELPGGLRAADVEARGRGGRRGGVGGAGRGGGRAGGGAGRAAGGGAGRGRGAGAWGSSWPPTSGFARELNL